MIRDLVRIRCCVVLQESNCHGNYHASSPAAPFAPGRQISGYPPASGSRTTLTRIPPCRLFLVASSLSPHCILVRFVAHPVGCPRFCFVGSWVVGLTMGGAESRGADVAVSFSGWSLWKVRTIFRRCMTAEEGFRYSLLPGNPPMQPNSIALEGVRLLPWHRLHCLG